MIIFIMLLLLMYVCSIPATLYVEKFHAATCLYFGGMFMMLMVAQFLSSPHGLRGIKWFILSVLILILWPLVALRLVYICYLDKRKLEE